MFIKELHLYIDYLKEQLKDDGKPETFSKKKKYYTSFYQNILAGISYYRNIPGISHALRNRFIKALDYAEIELDFLNYQYAIIGSSE
jgi:hypothetical protein